MSNSRAFARLSQILFLVLLACALAFGILLSVPLRDRHGSLLDSAKRSQVVVGDYNTPVTGVPSVTMRGDVDSMYAIIKTGSSVLWKRLPIHLVTTFRKVKHFQVYSDAPTKIAGIQVVDALHNVSEFVKASNDFEVYRIANRWQGHHASIPEESQHGRVSITKSARNETIHAPRSIPIATEGGSGVWWNLDKYKNLPMLAHAWRNKPEGIKWFVFMDADTYILWDHLSAWLNRLDHTKPLYMGSVVGEVFEKFAHGGSGVVLSYAAMEATFGKHFDFEFMYDMETMEDCCGDHLLARALLDHGIAISDEPADAYPYAKYKFQGEPQWSVDINYENWCSPIMSFHHVSPSDIEEIFEMEQEYLLADLDIHHYDVFERFMKFYIEESKDDWNNYSGERVYTSIPASEYEPGYGGPDVDAPIYANVDSCHEACVFWKDCIQYRYTHDYCGLSSIIKLGQGISIDPEVRRARQQQIRERRISQGLKADNFAELPLDNEARRDTWTSGWIIHRVETFLAESPRCH
ncbi:hypothetical protein V1514DRAFT_337681 [Lipomyces japonicus]|uniref:uncharacterized protein n=1 Tax=Lipomyces japonicus TaxID=56871 RepID=UPI0034CDDD57